MDAATSFYQTLTSVSFTLLGLWFAVLGLSHGGWRSDPVRHRSTLHVALHFFLPGVMGLGSMLAGGNGMVWRVTFGMLGLIGLLEALDFLRQPRTHTFRTVRFLRLLDPVLYALVVLSAFIQGKILGLVPLQIEGAVTGLLFVVGICYVWFAFAQRPASDPLPVVGAGADAVPPRTERSAAPPGRS